MQYKYDPPFWVYCSVDAQKKMILKMVHSRYPEIGRCLFALIHLLQRLMPEERIGYYLAMIPWHEK